MWVLLVLRERKEWMEMDISPSFCESVRLLCLPVCLFAYSPIEVASE